jgi:hypothetical protein
MNDVVLGKIKSVRFGIGGYNDIQFGLDLQFGSDGVDGWGVGNFYGFLDYTRVEHDENCKWTEDERNAQCIKTMKYISKILNDAKVNNITDLKGIPVEVTFEKNMIKDWRVLTEVL